VVETLKRLEHEGYHFEVADGSLELLMRRATGWEPGWFRVESFRVITDDAAGVNTLTDKTGATVNTEATVKVYVDGRRKIATAEGNGPVNALDRALRTALNGAFPALDRVHLTDYKVRVLDTDKGTAAVTRVLIDSSNGDTTWTTIGVNENIIEASWQALLDSIHYGLLQAETNAADK
jgi:2-isopropylmalate synthase